MKVRLEFPVGDPRAVGGCINKKRPWVRQGATGVIVQPRRSVFRRHTACVMFDKARKGADYDVVSWDFIKTTNVVPRKAHVV